MNNIIIKRPKNSKKKKIHIMKKNKPRVSSNVGETIIPRKLLMKIINIDQ